MIYFLGVVNPIAFDVFGLEIRWYGIFIALAMLIGSSFFLYKGKQIGVSENDLMDVVLVCLPSAIVGARLYYVLFYDFAYYVSHPLQIFNTRAGGLAIHGGVIFAVLAGFILAKKRKLPFLPLIDFVAPVLILGQAIGRWGNYFNQEAHGGPTDLPWGIMIDGVKVHPTFLYESLMNFGIFLFLMFLLNRKKFDGQLICLYMILYSVGRFFIEGLRTDSLMIGPLRVAQVISLILISAGIYFYTTLRKRAEKRSN